MLFPSTSYVVLWTALIGSTAAQITTEITGSASPTNSAAVATHTVSVGAVSMPLTWYIQPLTSCSRMGITLSLAKLKQVLETSLVCTWSRKDSKLVGYPTLTVIAEFLFYPQNHSVARTNFGQPCIPYEITGPGRVGFWSEFRPVQVVLSSVCGKINNSLFKYTDHSIQI